MSDPVDYLEEGRSQKPAYGLGYYGHLDPEPRLVLVYLAIFSILAGVGFVAWLGWGWQAIVLAVVVAALGVGVLLFRGRRREVDASATHYDEARTETEEH